VGHFYTPRNNLSNNVKNIMAFLAEQRLTEINKLPIDPTPSKQALTSKISTQADMEAAWCRYWTHELKATHRYFRKLWEHSFVL